MKRFDLSKKEINICLFALGIAILAGIFCFFIFNKKDEEIGREDIGKDASAPVQDTGIFSEFYDKANEKISFMTLDEKIGQILLVHYPAKDAIQELQTYNFGGYMFLEKDFKGKTEEDVKNEMANIQNASDIPMLIAVDEEGGKVVRVSSNKNLSPNSFKSSADLYAEGGFERIRQDTIEKSRFLEELGINLNLAPVVDVTTDPNNYIYPRTLGKETALVMTYAETVIKASKEGKVSYTLKHFPGYGSNADTHKLSSVDKKSYEEILNTDIPPFRAGIGAGAEAVLVSHNVVSSIDDENPASISKEINALLRNELGFTGVIITDDLNMKAVSKDNDAVVKAVLAGNNLLIVSDYKGSIEAIKKGLEEGKISEELITEAAKRVIAWKFYKGMM